MMTNAHKIRIQDRSVETQNYNINKSSNECNIPKSVLYQMKIQNMIIESNITET